MTIFCILGGMCCSMHAQDPWVTKAYNVAYEQDVTYGWDTDYAGTTRALKMDIAYPTNDTPPVCGRPMVLIIHGGAWLGGTKDSGLPPLLLTDFAARGYVAASISYRLGMFQTEKLINCNISALPGVAWNCLNMQDTTEWVRAWYRGVQDGKGALRYLVHHSDSLMIDPRNVFVIGESAGAFNALGVAYLDTPEEKPFQCEQVSDALPPNAFYEQPCITGPGFATKIQDMSLNRSDLGDISGIMNHHGDSIVIRAVGALYGGLFIDLFSHKKPGSIPGLYFFHQPNDLVVPIGFGRLLAGVSQCASDIGSCQSIYGRPLARGGDAMKTLIDSLKLQGFEVPIYQYDRTNNQASCLEQILNPSTGGHQVDNYGLRSANMATFFRDFLDFEGECLSVTTEHLRPPSPEWNLYPNPASHRIFISSEAIGLYYELFRISGEWIQSGFVTQKEGIDVSDLIPGMYILRMSNGEYMQMDRFVKW